MSRSCPSCGADAARTRFCTTCGQPLSSPRRNPWAMIALGAAVVVALAVTGVLLLQPSSAAQDEASGPTIVPAPTTTAPTSTGYGRSTTTPYSNTGGGESAVVSAASQLRSTEIANAPQVDRLEGYWIAQISSKRDGLVADGIIYDEAAILALHQQLARQYPDVVLFESDRFASYSSSGFWISAVAIPYAAAADANAWCDRAGLSADACFAKRLSQTSGGKSTVPR